MGRLATAFVTVLLVATWLVLAPTNLGGQTAYVIVSGTSMEPLFHRGDLVVLRQTGDYEVGDVVTYQNPDYGPVIHRIIAEDGERYVLQGDNNSWEDYYRPEESDILGKTWIHLPGIGKAIQPIRTPKGMAIAGGLLGVMIVMSIFPKKIEQAELIEEQVEKVNEIEEVEAVEPESHPPSPLIFQVPAQLDELKGDMLFLSAILAIAFGILLISAFKKPVTTTAIEEVEYQHTGSFNYSAVAPEGIYDSEQVQTGEPVFLQLTDQVLVIFDYQLQTREAADLMVTYSLDAQVSDQTTGWKHTIELHPTTSFDVEAVTVSGILNLREVDAIIQNMQAQTGVERKLYSIAFIPHIAVTGLVGGQPIYEEFSPALMFHLDEYQMWVAEDSEGDPFLPVQAGTLERTYIIPNTMSILGLKLEVTSARWIASIVLILSLGGMALFGWLHFLARQPQVTSTREEEETDHDAQFASQAAAGSNGANGARPGEHQFSNGRREHSRRISA